MAINEQGIMALPEGQQAVMPQLSYMDSYDATRQGMKMARPDVDLEVEEAMQQMRAGLDQVSDEELQSLIDAVKFLYENPDQYAQQVAEGVKDGDLEAGVFPEEYDEEFLSSLLAVLMDEQRSRGAGTGMMMPPPQNFARGGIAEAARLVASQGRNGDTMLAHITPSEMRLLKSRGGSGTINPATGLPEFFLKKIFKAVGKTFTRVGKAIKSVLKSPIGRMIATIGLSMALGPAGFAMMSAPIAAGVASGAVTALSGGSLKDVLINSVMGYASAPGSAVSNFVGKYTGQFITNPTVQAAANAAIIGTGGGMLQGQSLKDSIQGGLTQGAIAGTVAYMQGATPAKANLDAEQASITGTESAIKGTKLGGGAQSVPNYKINPQTGLSEFDGTFTNTVTNRVGDVVDEVVTGTPKFPGASQPTAGKTSAVPMDIDIERVALPAPAAASTSPLSSSYTGGGARVTPSLSGTTPDAMYSLSGTGGGAGIRPPVGGSLQPGLGADTLRYPAGMGAVEMPTIPSVSTGVPPVGSTSGVPEVMDSLGRAGSGVMDIAKGNFSKGYEQVKGGLGDLFFPGTPAAPTSADIINSPQYKGLIDKGVSPNTALQTLKTELTPPAPGMLRTYGPGAAAVMGGIGLAGGFEPKPPPESEFAKDMRQPIDLSGNPSAYYIQGLPGVKYDERGQIIGSTPWSPQQTLSDVQVATPSYINYNPLNYQTPRRLNMGGIAALAQGGYPRRIGQISGPGTETSDDIPAMLSDGEFVMTASAVRGMGNGSRREGAKKMYALMHQLERNAARG
jgi:hypothetical protein